MDAATKSQESAFLAIPGEIRNLVYRKVLVQRKIHIGPSDRPGQPALLQVNSQIRQEAIQIYYRENRSKWEIYAFNADDYMNWYQSSPHRANAKLSLVLDGPLNWDNLLRWIEAWFEGKGRGLVGGEAQSSRAGATEGFFLLAKRLKRQGLSWEQIKGNLDLMHAALCAVNKEWAKERDAT